MKILPALAALLLAGTGIHSQAAGIAETGPAVVELRAVGMKFEGPSRVPAGWTTFRFINTSGMVHFAMIDDPPDGVTAELMSRTSGPAFQEAMDAMNAGDEEGVNTAFGKMPAWMGDMVYRGGPGLLSGGLTGETTVYLEPGHYVLECYIKTGGVFHTTSPTPGTLGMLHPLEVTAPTSGAGEPTANVSVNIDNTGLSIADGSFRAGANVIRVNFREQQAFPTFVGNDVHIARLDADQDLAAAAQWMDWRKPQGLETPTPVTFLGGINDMPAGSHGYIHVVLEPGDYALIGETPAPQDQGFTLPFSIKGQTP